MLPPAGIGKKMAIPARNKEMNFMIIAIFTGKGFTKDMYERLRQEVGWEADPPDGWIMHAVGFDESGELHMTNIWESSEKMSEAFVSLGDLEYAFDFGEYERGTRFVL